LSAESRALAAAIVTVTIWASAFVGIRALAATFSPGSIALGRLLVGTVVLAAFALPRPRPALSRGDLFSSLSFGGLWFGLYSVALNAGERQVDAGTAAMLVSLGPILIALLAAVFLGERVSVPLLAGCAVALAGTVVVAASASDGSRAGPSTQGVALCVMAVVAYAAAATLQKRALQTVPAAWVNLIGAAAACLACLPFAPGLVWELRAAGPAQTGWLVYLGVFPTAIGFTTWAYALGRMSVGRLAAMTYLMAPVTIALSWLLLAELPTAQSLAGGALCVAGVVLARSKW
jgi:drug/metabolite transporter (DMT)-like permease